MNASRGIDHSRRDPRTIVLVVVDQLAAKWLEAADVQDIVDLPNLDALRAGGASFHRAFTPNPVCCPARASLATGLSSPSHGLTECGYRLDPAVPTVALALQESGWRTGAFGKVHLLPQLEQPSPDYRPYGFDVTRITEDPRVGEWTEWVRQEHPSHYEAALATVWMEPDRWPSDEVDPDLGAQVRAARERHPQCKDQAYVLPFPMAVSQSAWITDRAIEFMSSAEQEDLYLHVGFVQPHNPFTPPPEFVDRVRVENIPDPVAAEWVEAPIPYYQQERYSRPSYETRDWRRDRHMYFADLAHLDHELDRVRRALVDTGRASNALVIFTSDHGELLHDHGLLGKWERHYDSCIRVPLILSGPRVDAGDHQHLVDLTDVAATCYDWAGVSHPTAPRRLPNGSVEHTSLLTGRSLLPLTHNAELPGRELLLVQSNGSHVDTGPTGWARTVRTHRHRYSRHIAGGGEQLFDLHADPDEQHNLADDETHDRTRSELLALLAEASVMDARPPSPRGLYQWGSW